MKLIEELRRRNVFRVAIAYLVASWLVIQLADILVPMLTLPEWVSRFIFLLLVVLFIPTLVAAWALELTPDGIRLEKNVDRSQSVAPQTGQKLNHMIIGVLALAVIVLLVDKVWLSGGEDGVTSTGEVIEKSVAVLPFSDLSQNQDQEWFADGLAEEILNALARTPDLLISGGLGTPGGGADSRNGPADSCFRRLPPVVTELRPQRDRRHRDSGRPRDPDCQRARDDDGPGIAQGHARSRHEFRRGVSRIPPWGGAAHAFAPGEQPGHDARGLRILRTSAQGRSRFLVRAWGCCTVLDFADVINIVPARYQ
ncbi:MAG: hypothetical protein P8Y01_01420 [Woeseiaceae bacterium]